MALVFSIESHETIENSIELQRKKIARCGKHVARFSTPSQFFSRENKLFSYLKK